MTDRELLEAAAKAAGIELEWDARGSYELISGISGSETVWNPRTDDGDALRLAVKLGIDIQVLAYSGYTVAAADGKFLWEEPHESDPYAATRRAIVRAAAAIGSALK